MSDAKFTPGPWRWSVDPKSYSVDLESTAGALTEVIRFSRWGMHGAMPEFLSLSGDSRWGRLITPVTEFMKPAKGREHHADWFQTIDHPDAHLIAAAPDMFAALETVDALLGYTMQTIYPELAQMVAAALTKARGEEAKNG